MIFMKNLKAVELKAFIPSKNFELSKRFYQDLGFTLAWADEHLAYFHHDNVSFLLQNFYVEALASNFMMHLLVEDVAAWHAQLTEADIAARYHVELAPLQVQPWRMRDFTIGDPSGVLWRIAQNID